MSRITSKEASDAYHKSKQPMCTELLDKIDRAIITAANNTQTAVVMYAPFVSQSTVDEVVTDLQKRGFKVQFIPNPVPHFTLFF